MYQALYRKWRPRTFDDVVGQEPVVETLKRQVETGRLSHAYLFTGSRGTGKTTCAKILARAVNCEHPVNGNPCNQCPSCLGIENGSILDVLELDAASNSGVDHVRTLKEEAVYTPAAVRKRVYIIDEVHMLSTAAFNALLKILEEPPAHLMFILATTELQKVPATILSRCQRFSFQRILPGDIRDRLLTVAGAEGIGLTEEGAGLLAQMADGALRDALSLLDQCSGGAGGELGQAEILGALGLAGNRQTAELMRAVAARDAGTALALLARLYGDGKDVGTVLGELSALARDLLILKTAPRGGIPLLGGGYDGATMKTLSKELSAARLIDILDTLQKTIAELSRGGSRRTAAELCLIRLCDETLSGGLPALISRVETLERRLEGESFPAAGGQARHEQCKTAQRLAESKAKAEGVERTEAPAESTGTSPAEAVTPASEAVGSEPEADESAVSRKAEPASWAALLGELKKRLAPPAFTFLNNPEMVSGRWEEGRLLVETDTEFTKNILQTEETKAALAAAVRMACGAPAPVRIQVRGAGGPAAAGKDKLDDLIAFGKKLDNFTIK